MENEKVKLLWDMSIQRGKVPADLIPDIVVLDKGART